MQQFGHAAISVTTELSRQANHVFHQPKLVIGNVRFSTLTRTGLAQHAANATFRDTLWSQTVTNMTDRFPSLHWVQKFPDAASLRIV